MTMIFIDGYDHYTERLDKYDSVSQSQAPAISTTEGRFLNGSLKVGGNSKSGDLIKDTGLVASQEVICGFAMKYDSTHLFELKFYAGGTRVAELAPSNSDIRLRDKDGTTQLTASNVLSAATWQFIEVRVKSHATLGEMEVHVNGVLVGSILGQAMDGSLIDKIAWEAHATSGVVHVDDFYMLNTLGSAPQNTFLGDVRVTVLRPKANGTENQFNSTEATNFEAVDDALQDGDATFVEAGQIGAKENYDNQAFADLGLAPGTIYGVQVVNTTKKTDAGRLDYSDKMVIAGTSFSNGVDVVSTAIDYKMTTFIRDTDPSDDAAWTEDKVAAVGSGVEITFREI